MKNRTSRFPDRTLHTLNLVTLAVVVGLAGRVVADISLPDPARLKAKQAVTLKAQPFELTDVRLLDGPFHRAQELDREYLLFLDPDRLLHTFRLNAGLPSVAKPLGGWEEPKGELRGHSAGHYLSACALMYASTGDERLKQKGDAVVVGLAECQAKMGSGYLSAYPEEFFDRVEAQQRVWAPYYTLHKIFAGLLDMHVYCGNQQALDVCKKFGDWVIARNARLSEEKMQRMLENEHGGMNEVLANLYALTGEEKYLKIAQRFNHMAVIGPASERVDRLTGLHANTQIPKFVGTARQYELTGDEKLRTASEFFWNTVVKERSYVIGGHSDGEMFSAKERLSRALGPATTETCNTYNMLKLTRHLFAWTADAAYADYYERALLNHILASQNPADGMMCYYVPLRSGMMRGGSSHGYCTPLNSFWCCTGTGIENHAKYGDSIYYHDGTSALFVNLFIASELRWRARQVIVRQETRFPAQSGTRLTVYCSKPASFQLRIRHPFWVFNGFAIKVNGERFDTESAPGSYAVIEREWNYGDVVEVVTPFSLRTEEFRDNPKRYAFVWGPMVLCAQVDTDRPLPEIVNEGGPILAGIQRSPGAPNKFIGSPRLFRIPGEQEGVAVTLEPFHQVHGARPYTVYWDEYTPGEWRAREEARQAEIRRRREVEARTVDYVIPGDQQLERGHKLAGEKTGAGEFGGRNWRHAPDGGWFSWELKVLPDQPQELWVTYWGSDGGNRVFDVLVDGQKLATQRLQNNQPDQFFDQAYHLPPDLLRGKNAITVKFTAHPGATAGGVFEVRVMRK